MLDKIGQNLGKILVIILLIIVFLLGHQCGNKIWSKNDFKTHIDTTIVHTTDTIFSKDTVLKYAFKPGKIKRDTITKIIYLDSTQCNRIYIYQDSIITKDYNIYSKKHIQGILRYDTIGVKLKVPLRIYDTTKITIKKDSLIFRQDKYQIHVGLLASTKMLAPSIDLSINKCTYLVAYDPFNKQPIIGFKYRLFSWTPKKKK